MTVRGKKKLGYELAMSLVFAGAIFDVDDIDGDDENVDTSVNHTIELSDLCGDMDDPDVIQNQVGLSG